LHLSLGLPDAVVQDVGVVAMVVLMGNVSSSGALKPTPIVSAAVFLDLAISYPNTARMIASSVC
jgi:hypothetical protein